MDNPAISQEDPTEVIPPQDPAETPPPKPEPKQSPEEEKREKEQARIRDLELENARLKGMSDARESQSLTPQNSEDDKYQRTKQTVNSDSQTLSEEDFQEKYKMSKGEVKAQMLAYEMELKDVKHSESLALLKAENTVAKKYGDKYSKHQDKIEEIIKDLAPSVRQDHKKLAEHMETRLRALMIDDKDPTPAPSPGPKKENPMNRRIVNSGFEPPNAIDPDNPSKKKEPEEIPEEHRFFTSKFGVHTESERKKFKEPFVDVEYGQGQVLTKDGVQIRKS